MYLFIFLFFYTLKTFLKQNIPYFNSGSQAKQTPLVGYMVVTVWCRLKKMK